MGQEEVVALREALAAQESAVAAEAIKAYLSVRDAPCIGCGYNLRGTTTGVCSECGRAIRFNENGGGHPPPLVGRWIVMLGALTNFVGGMVTLDGWGTVYLVVLVPTAIIAGAAAVGAAMSLRATDARRGYLGHRLLAYSASVNALIYLVWWWGSR